MDWEYGIIAQPIELGTLTEETNAGRIAEGFMKAAMPALMNLNKTVKNPPPNTTDVEAISHSILRVGSALVLTTLIRYHSPKSHR